MAEADPMQQAGLAGTGHPRGAPASGVFEGITSRDDAARLYMTLERARDSGDWRGGPDRYLSEVRGELLARFRILYDLDAYRRAPAPDQVVREAALWRAAAARTGLGDTDFGPQLLGAGTWEQEHLRAAAVFLLAGYDNAAGAELGLAMTGAAPASDAGSLIGGLRAQLGEAGSGQRHRRARRAGPPREAAVISVCLLPRPRQCCLAELRDFPATDQAIRLTGAEHPAATGQAGPRRSPGARAQQPVPRQVRGR
jgi:hypothetical protein